MQKKLYYRRMALVLVSILVAFSLVGCTPGPNILKNSENTEKELAGFWKGLWHGVTLFVTFIISLFNKNVNVYEVYNNGGWYNFGFLLGVMMIFGGSGGAGGKAASRR